jgi:hypothetical protein
MGILTLLAAVLALGTQANDEPVKIDPPKVVRGYVIPGVDPQVVRAELVRFDRTTTAADMVDMVAEFVPTYGQANNMVPLQMGQQGLTSVLFKFKNDRAIAALVRSGQSDNLSGPHGCRIFMDPAKGKPTSDEFAKIVHWCANAVALANIDPSVFSPGSP